MGLSLPDDTVHSRASTREPIIGRTAEFIACVTDAITRAGRIPVEVIPESAWEKLRSIAEAVANVVDAHGDFNYGNAQAIAAELGLRLLGKPEKKFGHFVVLHTIDLGIPGLKPGALMFAMIPEGHQAPKHFHRSPDGELPGEITVSWFGDLEYPVGDTTAVHTVNDRPRVSAPDSLDDYPVQRKTWVGAYVQFTQCDVVPAAA